MSAHSQHEALRQQMLLRALWRDAEPGVVAGWLRDGPRLQRGLQAYRANACALAERALAAAYPTVQQLLGEESFGALARALWQRAPPLVGDIACWGDALPDFIASDEQLAPEPYLADVARLEWALHAAASCADAEAPVGLALLAAHEPAALTLRLQPGSALVSSAHPIVTIWQAHRSAAEDRFAVVRAAFAAGVGEHAWVQRRGWRTTVRSLVDDAARFGAALLAQQSLGAALDAAGADFDFEGWLIAALGADAVAAVELRRI